MAELHDWLNRTVLYIENRRPLDKGATADLRVCFQSHVFVDNSTGWKDEVIAEIVVPRFQVDSDAIHRFVCEALAWLDTPIDQLGTRFFSGEWRFGAGPSQELSLSFGPFRDTPSKTDWFMVEIYLSAANLHWNDNLHVDYTCLAGFVQGLTQEGYGVLNSGADGYGDAQPDAARDAPLTARP